MKRKYLKPEFDFLEIKISHDLLYASAETPNIDGEGDGSGWLDGLDLSGLDVDLG